MKCTPRWVCPNPIMLHVNANQKLKRRHCRGIGGFDVDENEIIIANNKITMWRASMLTVHVNTFASVDFYHIHRLKGSVFVVLSWLDYCNANYEILADLRKSTIAPAAMCTEHSIQTSVLLHMTTWLVHSENSAVQYCRDHLWSLFTYASYSRLSGNTATSIISQTDIVTATLQLQSFHDHDFALPTVFESYKL